MSAESHNFINVTNEIGMSGQFLKLARNGKLVPVAKLIQGRAEIAVDLMEVEGLLVACNHPTALTGFALWCVQRHKDFRVQLHKKAQALETKKVKLQTELQQLDNQLSKVDLQLARKEPNIDWAIDTECTMTSLVPRMVRQSDVHIVERNQVIDEHPDLSVQDVCRVLDQNFVRDGECRDHLPKPWANKYHVRTFTAAYLHSECRKLVHKLISVRRRFSELP